MRTVFIMSGSAGDLLIKVPRACQNIESFDFLSPEQRRDFAISVIRSGAVVTSRLRGTDGRARIGDAEQLAFEAETCNPVLTAGRAPGVQTERERRRNAARDARLQRAYDAAGEVDRHARK